MEIEYRILKEITPQEQSAMERLYRENDWIGPEDSAEFIAIGMRNSAVAIAAFDQNGELVGMGRALSDDVSDAYIQDVAVSSTCRGKGIGAGIVRALIAELQRRGVDWIALVGAPGTEEFYRKLGFENAPGHTFWKLPSN